MANTIRIKRRPSSGSAGSPSAASLYNGELAFNENDNILYYAYGSGVGGISTAVPAIAGSGAYSLRGGTNATGTWPISINGNSAYATNAVYTTGNQNVNGEKTFRSTVFVEDTIRIIGSGGAGSNVLMDADTASIGLFTSNYRYNALGWYDKDMSLENGTIGNTTIESTFGKVILTGSSGVQIGDGGNGTGVDVAAATTSSSGTHFAAFTNYSNGGVIKARTAAQVKGDIGLGNVENTALSSVTFTAGSGLAGGGTLAANRTFNIGQGDGISVSADAIAVDNTVVRTTGTQTINGSKTFGNASTFNSGISIGDTINYLTGNALVINWGDGGGQLASFINNASQLNNSINLNAITTFDNVSYNSLFPFIIDPTGYNGYGAVTQGFWRGEQIEVNRGGTGRSSYSNGQLLIGSGTGLAANTLTAGSNVQITNGSGTITIAATGLALSSRTLTAGSGLVGGGDLSADRTFNIGQGDGITVSADSIAVDSTVVRTTGNQSINGVKTFGNRINISHTGSFANIPSLNIVGGGDNYFDYYTGQQGASSGYLLVGTHSDITTAPFRIAFDLVGGAAITNGEWRASTISVDKGGTGATTLTSNNILVGNGTNAISAPYSVETILTGGSSALPRADAVKTYVDNMIGSGIATNDAMIFKGTIDCSTNPNYPAADRGWVYKISVAGRIGGASGPVVEVNDTIICGTDGTAAGTHASVGSNWNILQTNIVDASILVTGPTSATSGNFAMFDGTTGKIVKDSSLNSSSFATANHTHGNITNAGAIGSTANLPIITTTAGALTTGSFGSTANTFCQGNDSRLSDTRNTTNSITVNNGGAGDSSSFTFNGSAARTISYNSIGAPSISGTNATGTWNISVTGNAGTVTNGVYTNGSYADPSWITSLAKSKVGLSNVENTALSTWAGSANLTTLGTVVTGTWNATTIAVDKGGTGQTSYTNGQLLIGNTTGNTLTKATLTQGTAIDITNGGGSITIGHNDTSTLTGAQGSNGIASFTVDGMGHVTAVTTATYLTAGTVCAAIVDCSLDGGTF